MIAVGVDTHKHEHVAKALDGLGLVLGGIQIKANLQGYLELLRWLRALDDDVVVAIEGASSYGAGLCELLLAEGIAVVEVERPRRQERRRGKSDRQRAALEHFEGEGFALTDRRPAGGRSYLVDQGFESMAEVQALVEDYTAKAKRLGYAPMQGWF